MTIPELSREILAEWDAMEKRQGGLTPMQLQTFAYRWLQMDGVPPLPTLLRVIAATLDANPGLDEREQGAQALIPILQYAAANAFDVMDAASDLLKLTMENNAR
jgi:hypothetical protein